MIAFPDNFCWDIFGGYVMPRQLVHSDRAPFFSTLMMHDALTPVFRYFLSLLVATGCFLWSHKVSALNYSYCM